MLQAALAGGTAHRRSVFELFGRRLPEGRRYGVVAGVGRALDALESFRFDDAALEVLEDVVDEPTREYLAAYRFTGDIWGYAEGETYFAHSPLLVVEASFAEAVVLETVLLSIYNHDSAIASAASRMTAVAGDRPCIEMGSRRTHEEAAVAAARAAYVAGLRHHLEPRRPAALRHPHGGHQRPLVHAAARLRGGRVPGPGRLVGRRHHPARRHLRRRRGGAARGGGRRARAGRGAAGLRRPGCPRPRGARPARLARRDRHPDRGDQRPRRARDRRARHGPGGRLRRGHPARDGQRAPDLRVRLQARRPRERGRPAGVGGQEERRQGLDRRPQVRPAPSYARRRRGGRGRRHRCAPAGTTHRTTSTATARSSCPWSATARSSAASPSTPRGSGTSRSRAELPPAAQQMSKGDPVIPTVFEGD